MKLRGDVSSRVDSIASCPFLRRTKSQDRIWIARKGADLARFSDFFPRVGIGLDSVEIGVNGRLDTGKGNSMQTMTRYGTRDLARARTFYDAIAETLGAARVVDRDNVSAYKGSEGGMFMIGTPQAGEATAGNGTQVVFGAPSRAAVDAAHAKAIELGGTCEGPPGLRGPEEMGYYAAYFRDLDGNKIMVSRVGVE
jgi:catechol 2,3-dioxygenase-like lactoylglutathione lyase family enzyme